jgi:tetratricopeptide (TPR) repeat protein
LKRVNSVFPEAFVVFFSLIATSFPLIPGRAEDNPAILARAEELAKGGKGEESTRLYRQALSADPQCWQAYAGIGRNHFAAGEYADAAADFRKALEFHPNDLELINWASRTFLRQQHPEKIPELLSHDNLTVANSALAHLLLARAYDAEENEDQATHEIGLALEIDPRCHGAHFAQGFMDWRAGDLPNAEKKLQEELSLDPHETLASYYLAEVLEKQDKLAEAEGVLTRMGREDPNTYLYQLAVGKLRERQKDIPSATDHYRQAIRLDAGQPEAHYRLAVLLRALRQSAQANEEFHIFSQLQSHTARGMGQGMGRVRPPLPDFD